MSKARTLTSVFVIVLFAVLIGRLAWRMGVLSGNAVLSKDGLWEYVWSTAFNVWNGAAVAGIVAVALTTAALSRQDGGHRPYLSAALVGGLILSAAPFYLPVPPWYDWQVGVLGREGTEAFNWVVVCAIFLAVAYALVSSRRRYSSPSGTNAREGAPASEAAGRTGMSGASETARRCFIGCAYAPFGAAIAVAILTVLASVAAGGRGGAGALIGHVLETTLFAWFHGALVALVIGFPALFLLALIRLDNFVVLILAGGAVGFVFSAMGAAFAAVSGLGGFLTLGLLSAPVIAGAAAGFLAWVYSRPAAPLRPASNIANR